LDSSAVHPDKKGNFDFTENQNKIQTKLRIEKMEKLLHAHFCTASEDETGLTVDINTQDLKIDTNSITMYLECLKQMKECDISEVVLAQIRKWEDFSIDARKGNASKYCQFCLRKNITWTQCKCGKFLCNECVCSCELYQCKACANNK